MMSRKFIWPSAAFLVTAWVALLSSGPREFLTATQSIWSLFKRSITRDRSASFHRRGLCHHVDAGYLEMNSP